MDKLEFYQSTFSTLIVTNNTKYLEQCIKSSINPTVVFDGVPIPVDGHYHSIACNASRPSIARNVGLQKIENSEFVQFLDSDDYLNEDYFDTILSIVSQNKEFNVFYTDYNILNEDFNFTNREYLRSVNDKTRMDDLFRIKNPLVRMTKPNTKKFDGELTNFEIVDYIVQFGIDKIFHIPYSLQTVRIHSKNYNRISDKRNQKKSLDIINGRINDKI